RQWSFRIPDSSAERGRAPPVPSSCPVLPSARPPGAGSDRSRGPPRSRSAVALRRSAHPVDGRPASSSRRAQAIPSCAWTGPTALPCQAHRQLDVLLGGQRGDEVEELEDETDLLQAIPNELGIAEVD